jgi:hypothetical protein
VRQGRDVRRQLGLRGPAVEHQGLAFAERDVETVGPERGQPIEAAQRHVALDGGELEG